MFRTRLIHSEKFGTSADALLISEANSSLSSGGKTDRCEVLRLREHTLKKKLRAAVESKACELERRRQSSQKQGKRPLLVAIIGYTNAGKTTLIKRFVFQLCISVVFLTLYFLV